MSEWNRQRRIDAVKACVDVVRVNADFRDSADDRESMVFGKRLLMLAHGCLVADGPLQVQLAAVALQNWLRCGAVSDAPPSKIDQAHLAGEEVPGG